jgi:hypothetical protein
MQENQQRAPKGRLIALMQAGYPWHEAAAMAGMQIVRSAAYQLLHNVRMRGDAAFHPKPCDASCPARTVRHPG